MRNVTMVMVAVSVVLFGYRVADAERVSIASSNFTFAIGADVESDTEVWSEAENPGNSPHTQDVFTFSPNTVGDNFSRTGPTFLGATLADSLEAGDQQAWLDRDMGIVTPTTLDIVGSYDGLAPGNAAAVPDYRLEIVIDNLSIYVGAYDGDSATLSIGETTAGHAGSSSATALIVSTAFGLASSYTLVAWNPRSLWLR